MIKRTGTLTVTTPSDCVIVMTRMFDAPRELVFEALTQCDLVKRWLYGPDGWSMDVCKTDLRVGGVYRYAWSHVNGSKMAMGGTFTEVNPPERLTATEKFDEAWYQGEAVSTTVLTKVGDQTRLTLTITYQSREVRDAVLKTPMEAGVELGYDRLADILAASIAKGA